MCALTDTQTLLLHTEIDIIHNLFSRTLYTAGRCLLYDVFIFALRIIVMNVLIRNSGSYLTGFICVFNYATVSCTVR
jgi:hypothetical protein